MVSIPMITRRFFFQTLLVLRRSFNLRGSMNGIFSSIDKVFGHKKICSSNDYNKIGTLGSGLQKLLLLLLETPF